MNIRLTQAGDIPALQTVLDKTGLFPSEMLEDMLAPFLSDTGADALWLTCLQGCDPQGFCFAKAEDLTDGTWNMLAIAVDPDRQRKGTGRALTTALEGELKKQGARILIVDTSGTEDFAQTRAFYAGNGYEEEARIRDFWAAGDDKVIFRKAL